MYLFSNQLHFLFKSQSFVFYINKDFITISFEKIILKLIYQYDYGMHFIVNMKYKFDAVHKEF